MLFFSGRSIPGIFVYLGDAPKIYENPNLRSSHFAVELRLNGVGDLRSTNPLLQYMVSRINFDDNEVTEREALEMDTDSDKELMRDHEANLAREREAEIDLST